MSDKIFGIPVGGAEAPVKAAKVEKSAAAPAKKATKAAQPVNYLL